MLGNVDTKCREENVVGKHFPIFLQLVWTLHLV